MDPSIIAAGISAAGVGTSALLNATKRRGSTRMMEVSKQLAQYNTALSEDMYNKYQSPAAMMRQYKEAGLNPYLVYGNAQPSGPSAGEVSTNPSDYGMGKENSRAADAVAGISQSLANYYSLRSQQLNNSNAAQVLALNQAKEDAQHIENDFRRVSNSYQLELLSDQVSSARSRQLLDEKYLEEERKTRLEKDKEDILNSRKDRDVKDASIRKIDKDIAVSDGIIKLNEQKLKGLEQDYLFNEKANPLRLKGMQLSNSNSAIGYQVQAHRLGREKFLDQDPNRVNPLSPEYAAYGGAFQEQQVKRGKAVNDSKNVGLKNDILTYQRDHLGEDNDDAAILKILLDFTKGIMPKVSSNSYTTNNNNYVKTQK